jgi:hypothetical protein
MRYAVLAGRQLFSLIFILASAEHFGPAAIHRPRSMACHGQASWSRSLASLRSSAG